MRTRRRGVTLVAAAAVLLAGCTSSSDDELDLGTDARAAPDLAPSPDPDPEDTEPPEPDDPDEPLFPPLPEGEVDPDLGAPVETQEGMLERHRQVYEATQQAYATLEGDREDFEALIADPLLSEFITALEAYRTEGHVTLGPDTRVAWLRVTGFRNGPIDIDECRVIGPRSGLYDPVSFEPVDLVGETVPVVVRTTYELVGVADSFEYRAVEMTSFGDEDECHA